MTLSLVAWWLYPSMGFVISFFSFPLFINFKRIVTDYERELNNTYVKDERLRQVKWRNDWKCCDVSTWKISDKEIQLLLLLNTCSKKKKKKKTTTTTKKNVNLLWSSNCTLMVWCVLFMLFSGKGCVYWKKISYTINSILSDFKDIDE